MSETTLISFEDFQAHTDRIKEFFDSAIPNKFFLDGKTIEPYYIYRNFDKTGILIVNGLATKSGVTVNGKNVTVPSGYDTNTQISITGSGEGYSIRFSNAVNVIETADNISIYGAASQNTITANGNYVTIQGNGITSNGDYASLSGSSITSNGDYATISSARVISAGDYASISGLGNSGVVTITGNDNTLKHVVYYGNLNNSVENYGHNSCISLRSGLEKNYSVIISSGNNATLVMDGGTGASSREVNGSITSSGENVYIEAKTYNGAAVNGKVTISGGSATVTNFKTIGITGNNAFLRATSGNDSITIFEGVSNSTVFGIAGNDSIINNSDGNIFRYSGNASEGTDSLTAFNSNDVISIDDSTCTVNSVTIDGGARLQITNGTANTYVVLQGKTTGDTINLQRGNNAVESYVIS